MFSVDRIAKVIVLSCIYYAAARFGLHVQAVHGFASLIWLPTGIAISALLYFGRGLWPGIALGAFLANFAVGGSFVVAGGIALGNTLEAVAAIALLSYLDFDRNFGRIKDAFN